MGNTKSKKYKLNNPIRKIAKKFGYMKSQDNLNQPPSEAFVRKWNRTSRRRWHHDGAVDRYAASKTAWPVPLVESLFLPDYEIKAEQELDDFEVLDVIARGAFGNVLKVRREDDKKLYAVKVLTKSQVIVEGAVKQSKDEATIQCVLGNHPYIVQAHWYWQSRKFLYIVSDYIPNGELFTLWKYHGAFSERLVKLYVAEMALVLDYLHTSGVVYRDIKMENILLDEEGHLQVIDFGLAKWLSKGNRTRTICGTLQYIAPEILSLQPYAHSCDWWSLGILMYALLTGEYPVGGARNHKDMADRMKQCDYDIPEYLHWDTRAVLEKLLMKDPAFRITNANALQRMAYFQDVNFRSVQERLYSPRQFYTEEDLNMFPGDDYMREHIQMRDSEILLLNF
ncbi:serine/threonine-protein kinase S6KL-like isoform X2 [Lineus longissimus]|uniref:serine/threonine-protein kinase S6KL-like isoform X2 n=1 Tax=Lineus longissimus TaxID=88925 RepID=UPI002B4E491A